MGRHKKAAARQRTLSTCTEDSTNQSCLWNVSERRIRLQISELGRDFARAFFELASLWRRCPESASLLLKLAKNIAHIGGSFAQAELRFSAYVSTGYGREPDSMDLSTATSHFAP